MIDLGSIAGLYEHEHELHAYCLHCDRWRELNLEWLIRQGKGAMRLPIRVRCLRCGELGKLQVRPTMPKWSNANGWISLPSPSITATEETPPVTQARHRSRKAPRWTQH